MKIEILPSELATPLAVLSLTGIDNRELNPAIEKQLTLRQLTPAQPQNALADLLVLIGDRHHVQLQAWDMAVIPAEPVQIQVLPDQPVTLLDQDQQLLPANLDAKSSRVLVVIGDAVADDATVHATGQELQRKVKAFFGLQARLQFRTSSSELQPLNTTKIVS
ncbi:hypothetical protein RA086_10810 [Lactiplantibacillus sp. WILCCON 0030]|uniref:Uncharacterized protein n=1 Tax=Lactiplantibacillus brownii TaxID=3069269 RepID=A0ABU1ABT2_9LACO|nr:hypothetical protein [Lactiplantibacillus brownii]MDQ7938100.1 hypothetical protein [Lactiplantibacillus brownii]